jgi:hypothetical protein
MERIYPTCEFCTHEAAWLVPRSTDQGLTWHLVCWTHLISWRVTADRNRTFYFLDEEEDGFSVKEES